MRLSLMLMTMTVSLGARAQGLPKLDFDRGAAAPAAIVAGAATVDSAGPVGARVHVSPLAAEAKPAQEAFRLGKSGARVVEQTLRKGKVLEVNATLCYQDPGDLACWNEASKEPVHVPESLLPKGERRKASSRPVIAQAFDEGASAITDVMRGFEKREPGFRLAHNYNTRNGNSTYSCYHVTLYENCRWVPNGGGPGGVNGEWRCDKVEGPHDCVCISGC